METISFKVEARDLDKKARAVRDNGRIPAVLYGGDVLEHFAVEFNDIKSLIYTPDFKLAEIEVGGKKHKCIVKNIQFHPVNDEIQHLDFLAIEEGRKVKVELPIRFTGVSPGVKNGGKLMQSMRKVRVKVDPAYLVDELIIDISKLKLGDSVRVKDIEVNENMEFLVNENIPVASVVTPRALKSIDEELEEAAALEAEEAAEGEAEEGAEGTEAEATTESES